MFRLQVAITKPFMRTFSHLITICSVLVLSACASNFKKPNYEAIFAPFVSNMEIVQTDHFKHLLIRGGDPSIDHVSNVEPLVVFIEGDGLPWAGRYTISPDPTTENALLLSWFENSGFNSVYLGRPCYFALEDPVCDAYWYTHGRYSDQVVESLKQALIGVVRENQSIVLLGHSGGGTLALLLAERLDHVLGVVTVSGNVDVKSWIYENSYSKLEGSLDPGQRKPLNESIKQIHYYSYGDKVIFAEWIKEFASWQKNVELHERDVAGHSSAWHPYKEDVFSKIQELIASPD